MGRLKRIALGALFWTLGGCFSYVSAPPSGARLGEQVRVRVSGAEADRLESTLGVNERNIEGELLEQADSNVVLGVALAVPGQSGTNLIRAQQRITIGRSQLQDIETRRLDKFRTSLLIGGSIAAVVAIAATTGHSLLGGSGATGSPNENRIPRGQPLLRLRLTVP